MSDVSVALCNVADLQRLSNPQGNHHYDSSEFKLEKLTLDEIETKMVVEAHYIDVESKLESGFGASGHPPAFIVEEPITQAKGAGLSMSQKTQKEDWQVSPKEGLEERVRQV